MVLDIANKRDQRKRPLRHRRQGRKHSVCAAEGAALIAVDDRAARKSMGYLRTIKLDDPSDTVPG
jgi:hypothetical protein